MQEPKTDLISTIVENLVAVMPLFHRKLVNVLDEGMSLGLSHYHFAIMGMLSKYNTLPVSEFCRRLMISKSQMTMILDKLVEKGLVSRSTDEADRRIIRISITPLGKGVLNQAVDNIKVSITQKMAHLEKQDLELFARSLKNIIEIGSKMEQ
jgi:DNA-binding MarR family transcriptional regulator